MVARASGPVKIPHSHQVLPSASREAKNQLKKIVPSWGPCWKSHSMPQQRRPQATPGRVGSWCVLVLERFLPLPVAGWVSLGELCTGSEPVHVQNSGCLLFVCLEPYSSLGEPSLPSPTLRLITVSTALPDQSREGCWLRPGIGFKKHYPQTWHLEYFKLKEFEKMAERGMSLFSPETGHKALMWEVPSLYQKERSILISEDKGTLRWNWTVWLRFPAVYYNYHILLTFSTTVHSSSNRA